MILPYKCVSVCRRCGGVCVLLSVVLFYYVQHWMFYCVCSSSLVGYHIQIATS